MAQADNQQLLAAAQALKPKEVIKLNRMRGVVTRRVTAGHAIPNTTLMVRVDCTDAIKLQRELINEWRPKRLRPQYQDLVVTAMVRAIKEYPLANSHLIDDSVYVYEKINVGIAVAIGEGLMVPTIKDAQDKSLLEIAESIREIVRAVKNGKLSPANVETSTITVSSLAGYGVEGFTPIINAPETNVLGIGRVTEEPRFIDGELQNRQIGHLSLTFDHRAWDGAPASQFLNTIAANLKDPTCLTK